MVKKTKKGRIIAPISLTLKLPILINNLLVACPFSVGYWILFTRTLVTVFHSGYWIL